ncbi:MAG: hypothetical protein CL917_19560 [Deltaproteobacteria bacterium]|nr:hypothetical protein [Deltaproteobacteria bacterium]
MAMKKSPTEIAKEYLASLRRSASGEASTTEYLEFWSDEIEYILPGLWPMAGRYSKAEHIEIVAPMMESNVEGDRVGEPDTGLYGYEFIEEGNKVCVLARSRGRDHRNLLYMNTFCLWMEFNDDGKLVRYLDEADFSSSWQAFWGVQLQ